VARRARPLNPMKEDQLSTIFSRIAAREIPAVIVAEDDAAVAFMDIAPASRGHVLVIAREAYPDIFSIPPATWLRVMALAQRVAQAIGRSLAPDGINIVQNNGAAAGQTVFHLHVHLIPRWSGDGALALWHPGATAPEQLDGVARQIRAALGDD